MSPQSVKLSTSPWQSRLDGVAQGQFRQVDAVAVEKAQHVGVAGSTTISTGEGETQVRWRLIHAHDLHLIAVEEPLRSGGRGSGLPMLARLSIQS
jgi:hypothetical protein